jgi:hypothetical protein
MGFDSPRRRRAEKGRIWRVGWEEVKEWRVESGTGWLEASL